MDITVVIPAFNESKSIRRVLEELIAVSQQWQVHTSIIVVDDGSTDGTSQEAQSMEGVQVITHPYNKGYGAALKTGIREAASKWVVTYDADGQHTPDLIEKLIPAMNETNDLVVGKRDGYKGPLIRQPGKWLIQMAANYLVERKIPDLNSGLRAFRRDTFLRYEHLFPNGFSLSTTSTVCFFKENLNVEYVPITIQGRTGKSTVKPLDAIKTIMFVLRLTMLFSPFRIFLPLSFATGCITAVLFAYEIIINRNISDAGVALLTLTGILFFFGLIADQVSALRRDIGRHSSF